MTHTDRIREIGRILYDNIVVEYKDGVMSNNWDKASKKIAALLAEAEREARIDEWDFIETLRETSDIAMQESMKDRLKVLEETE